MAAGEQTQGERGAGDDVFARLDDAFAHQRYLSPALVASVHAWQGIDRRYELIQKLAGGSSTTTLAARDLSLARTVRIRLDVAIASGRMPFATVVYRGVRDLRRALGIDYPAQALGRRFHLKGFTATTVSRRVAIDEFTQEGGGLFEIAVPAGVHALWVANVGRPELRRQGELLLGDGVGLHVYSLGCDRSIPVLRGKVRDDR